MPSSFINQLFGFPKDTEPRQILRTGVPFVVTGTVPTVINFPQEFGGYAVDVSVNNLDTLAILTYRINSRSATAKTVSIAGVNTLTDVQVVQLEIIAGTNWEVQFNIVPQVR